MRKSILAVLLRKLRSAWAQWVWVMSIGCLSIGFTGGACGFWAGTGQARAAAAGEGHDRTLSPYFLVRGGDPELDQLPLKETSARVTIAGVIADVQVVQVYENAGGRTLEAIYVFPGSTRAAVYSMRMTIGERTIVASVEEREAARRSYEQARDEGRTASLLEQQRPNVFQMNVANILPGDVIRVEMSYTEVLVPEIGVYEFVYPAVVGPRYVSPSTGTVPASDHWIQNPYLHQGEPAPYDLDIEVGLDAGLPIREALCNTHRVEIRYASASRASIRLDKQEKTGGNRDFILQYRLAGDRVHSGLLLYEGKEENFFLMMAQPPKRVTLDQVPPREYIFVIDVSGSMHGFPLDISKQLLRDLLSALRPTDRFNVLPFAGGSTIMAEASSVPATPENIRAAIDLIDGQRGGGGTELLPALKRALALPRAKGFSRSVLVVTDGYVSIELEAFDLIRASLGDANLFAFGIGTSVNRYLIEGLARAGIGEPFIVTRPEEAGKTASRFRELVQWPVLTQVRLECSGFEIYDVDPPAIPDLLAERPLVVVGKWKGLARGAITLKGIGADGLPYVSRIAVAEVQPQASSSALRYLWARQRVALLSDYNQLLPNDARVKEVTELGLRYHLLTAYTSFVALDSQVRAREGGFTTVRQPLPLPQGVSDLAVGGMAAPAGAKNFALPTTAVLREDAARSRFQGAPDIAQGKGAVEPRAGDEAPAGGRGEKGTGLRIKAVVVTGGLTEEGVRSIVQLRLPGLAACLAKWSGQGAAGGMIVECRVDATGNVTDVRLVSTPEASDDLRDCVLKDIKGWLLPPSPAGKPSSLKVALEWG